MRPTPRTRLKTRRLRPLKRRSLADDQNEFQPGRDDSESPASSAARIRTISGMMHAATRVLPVSERPPPGIRSRNRRGRLAARGMLSPTIRRLGADDPHSRSGGGVIDVKVTVPLLAQNRWRVAGLLDDIPLQPKIECANRRQARIMIAMLSGMRSESHPLRGSAALRHTIARILCGRPQAFR